VRFREGFSCEYRKGDSAEFQPKPFCRFLIRPTGAGIEWEARGLESAGREGDRAATVSGAGRVWRWVGGVAGYLATRC
jgi:hypothetical protein